MGVCTQLRLLLYKNFLLRTRQPAILVLEIFWPIAIVLVVLAMRMAIPPVQQDTCYYNARALPSAGGMAFMQSLVCNIDNDCQDNRTYEEIPSYKNARVDELVSQVSPLMGDGEIIQLVKALPKGVNLMRAVIDTLGMPQVQEMLDKGLPVSRLLKDPRRIQQILQDEVKINSPRVAESLATANVSIHKLLQLMNGSPGGLTETTVCRPESLAQFLVVHDRRALQEVANGLCALEPRALSRLVSSLQAEIDPGKVVKMVSDLMSQFGRPDVGLMLQDIVTMLSTFFRLPSVVSGMTGSAGADRLAGLNLTRWLPRLKAIVEPLKNGDINLALIGEVAQDIEPLLDGDPKGQKVKKILKYVSMISNLIKHGLKSVTEPNLTLGSILKNGSSLSQQLQGSFSFAAVQAMMKAKLKPGMEEHLKELLSPRDIFRVLCESPGLAGLFALPPQPQAGGSSAKNVAWTELQAFQDALCVLHLNSTVFQIARGQDAAEDNKANQQALVNTTSEILEAVNHMGSGDDLPGLDPRLFLLAQQLLDSVLEVLSSKAYNGTQVGQLLNSVTSLLDHTKVWRKIQGSVATGYHFLNVTLSMALAEGEASRKEGIDMFWPYLLESLLATLSDNAKWKDMLNLSRWPGIACQADQFRDHFVVPEGIRADNLQTFTCAFLGQPQVQIREAIAEKRSEAWQLDWRSVMTKAGAFVEMVQESVRNRNYLNLYNWQRLDQVFRNFSKTIWNNSDFRNRTSVVVGGFAQVAEWLDQAQFRYTNDYKALLFSLHKIISMFDVQLKMMIESNSIRASHLSLGLSILTRIQQDLAQELPDAIRVVMAMIGDPTQLFEKVGNSAVPLNKIPCAKGTVADFLPFRNRTHVLALEKFVCRAYKQLPQEILSDPSVGEMLSAIHNVSKGVPLSFSWQDIEDNLISVQEHVRVLQFFNGSLFPDVPAFNRTDLDLAIQEAKDRWPDIQRKYQERRFVFEILDSVLQLASNSSSGRRPSLASLKWNSNKTGDLFDNLLMSSKFTVWASNEFMDEVLKYAIKLKNNALKMDDLLSTSLLRDLWDLFMNFPYVSEVVIRSMLNPAFADVLEDFIQDKKDRTVCSSYSAFVQLVQFGPERRHLGETAYIVLCQLNKDTWQEAAQQIWRGSAFSALIEKVSRYWYSQNPASIPVRVLSFFDKVSQLVQLTRQMVAYPPLFRWGGEMTLLKPSVWEHFGTSTFDLMRKASKLRFTIATQPIITLLEHLSQNSQVDLDRKLERGSDFLKRLADALQRIRDDPSLTLESVSKEDPVLGQILNWAEKYLVDGLETVLYTFAVDSRKLSPFFQLGRTPQDLVCNESFTDHFLLPSHIMNRKSLEEGRSHFCNNTWFQATNKTITTPEMYLPRMKPRDFVSHLGRTLDLLVNSAGQDPKFLSRTSPLLMGSTWAPLVNRFYGYYKLPPTNDRAWIAPTVEKLLDAIGNNKVMVEFVNDMFALTSCTLDKVKGGLRWNYFELEKDDRRNLLSFVKVLNDSAELVQTALHTLSHLDKLQRIIQDFVVSSEKKSNFCGLRDWSGHFVASGSPQKNSLNSLQALLCRTNYTAALVELNPAVYCTFTHEERRPEVVSRSEMERNLRHLFENTTQTILASRPGHQKPQSLVQFNLPWRNATRWLGIFRGFSEDVDAAFKNFTIDSFPGWIKVVGVMFEDFPESWATFNFFHDFVSNLVKNVQFFNDTSSSTIPLERIFTRTPYLRDVLTVWLPRLPEIVETTMWSLMAPRKILPLLTTRRNNVKASVCRSSVTEYLYNPRLKEEDWEKLRDLLCHVSFSQLYNDLKILTPINSQILRQKGSRRPVNWSGLSQSVEQLLGLLSRLVVAKPTSFVPGAGSSGWRDPLSRLGVLSYHPVSDPLTLPLFLTLNGVVNGANGALGLTSNCSQELRVASDYGIHRDIFQMICTSGRTETSAEILAAVRSAVHLVQQEESSEGDFRFRDMYLAAQEATRVKVLLRNVAGDRLVRHWEKEQRDYWTYLDAFGQDDPARFGALLDSLPDALQELGETYIRNITGLQTALRGLGHVLRLMRPENTTSDQNPFSETDLASSPSTQALLTNLLRVSGPLASTFLWTTRMPLGLKQLVSSSGGRGQVVLSGLCNGTLSEILPNPALSAREFVILQDALCQHNHSAIWQEVNALQEKERGQAKMELSTDPLRSLVEQVLLLVARTDTQEETSEAALPLDTRQWRKSFRDLARASSQPEVAVAALHQNVFQHFCGSAPAEFRLPSQGDRAKVQEALCRLSGKDFATRVGLAFRKLSLRRRAASRLNSGGTGRTLAWQDLYGTLTEAVAYEDLLGALLPSGRHLQIKRLEKNFLDMLTFQYSGNDTRRLPEVVREEEAHLQETEEGRNLLDYFFFAHTFLEPTVRNGLDHFAGTERGLTFRLVLKNQLEASYLIRHTFLTEESFIATVLDMPLTKQMVMELIFQDPVAAFCNGSLLQWREGTVLVSDYSSQEVRDLLCSPKGHKLLVKLSESININKIMGQVWNKRRLVRLLREEEKEEAGEEGEEEESAVLWSDVVSGYRQMQKISRRVSKEIQTGQSHLLDPNRFQSFVDRVLKSSKILNAYKVSDLVMNGVRFVDKILHNSSAWQTGVGFTRAILDATNYYLLADSNESIYAIVSNGTNLGETIKRILESQSTSLHSLSSHQVIHALKVMSRYYSHSPAVLTEACQRLDSSGDEQQTAASRRLLDLFCQSPASDWLVQTKAAFRADHNGSYLAHALTALAKLVFVSPKAVQVQIRDWLHGTNMADLEPLFRSIVGKFVKAPGGFYELDGAFLRPIPLAIWEAFPIMLRAQGNLWCLHGNMSTSLILASSLAQGYLAKIPDPEVIFCDLPKWSVTQVYRWISRNFEIRKLAQITQQLLSKHPRRPRQCASPLAVLADLLDYGNRLWRALRDPQRSQTMHQCVTSFFNATLLRNMNKYGEFVRNVSAVVQETSGRSSNELEVAAGIQQDATSFSQLWKKISQFVSSQLPAFQTFGSFLRQSSNLEKTLRSPPHNFSEDVFKTLLNSSLNLNWVARLNFSASAIEHSVCSRLKLRPFLLLQQSQAKPRPAALAQALCRKGGLAAALGALDATRILKELPRLQHAQLLKGDWLEHLIKNVQTIVKHFLDLTSVGGKLMNRFSSGATADLLANMVQVLRENTVDKLLASLQGLLDKVEPAVEGGKVTEDIKLVLQGLRSLKSLQGLNLFNIRYRLSDLFVEPHKVSEFLRDELDLHETAIQEVLAAQLDLSQVVGSSNLLESVQELMCNPDELRQLLRLRSNEVTVENVTNTLCSLSSTQTLTISSQLIGHVAFTKIIQNFVEVGIDGVLGKVNLTWSEAVGAVNVLKTAPVVMPKLRRYMGVFTSALDRDIQEDLSKLNISTEGIRLLGSPTALKAFGKLLCGKKLKALAQEFELLKVSNKEPTLDTREIDDLPSEFCRTGYKQVMRMVGGPILWGFLKPVLRGKILFAPKTALSQAVFTEVNKTFDAFAGFVGNLQAWGQGIAGLNYLKTRKDTLDKMKELLRSDSIQPIMRQVVGSDATNLLDEFDIASLGNQLSNVSGLLDLMQLVGNMSQCFELNRFHGFDTELELEITAQKLSLKREFIAAVVFVDEAERKDPYRFRRDLQGKPLVPKHIKYKLRMDIDNVPSTRNNRLQFWRPGPRDDFIDDHRYFRGFLQYQEMIDNAIISLQARGQTPPIQPATFLQQFPYPCYQKDSFGLFLKGMLPVIMTVCWLFLVAFLIREFVLEKELQLEELLRVMGLRPWIAWLAWFLAGLSILSTGVAFCTLILKYGGIFPYTDVLILFIFLMEYAVLVLMYCYLISCIFKTATIAALTGVIVYLITFLPFVVIISLEAQLDHWQKLLSSTLVSSGFCYGCLHVIRYEDRGIGLRWENIWYSAVPNEPMTFAWTLFMLALDSVLYGLLGWYISNVWPANSARKQPWYFFMSPTYWGLRRKHKNIYFRAPKLVSGLEGDNLKNYDLGVALPASCEERCGISLRGLDVVYNQGKPLERVAVSGLTLDFMEGHITTLLGQNGAGKTTTINVLTGQIPPTSGTVFVCEKHIPHEFSQVQKFLGYCPQYNTLFARMSVREHLLFYGELKGILHGRQLQEDVDEMLQSMGLWHMQKEQARFLSGGMQRRLCVALAFIGGSKVVILDEPTSSVDPVARRNIWDLIVKYRQGRTILLTTHHMDEADILSDKVAIIHKGKLLCQGSPLLLKSKFGCGYQLTLVRQSDPDQDSDSGRASSSCSEESSGDTEDILTFVQGHASLARLMEDNGTEVVISLPQRDQDGCLYPFSELFRRLDDSHLALGFSSYGVSSTTLEEVFLTLCGLDDNTALLVAQSEPLPMRRNSIAKQPDDRQTNYHTDKNGLDLYGGNGPWSNASLDFGCPSPMRGFRLKTEQLQALLLKRYYHTLRDWKSLCSGILLPCAFIAFAMGFSLIKPEGWGSKEPPLFLSPPMYGPNLKNFYHFQGPEPSSLAMLRDGIFEPPGLSPACLRDAPPEGRAWCGRSNVSLVTDQGILTAGGLCSDEQEADRLLSAQARYGHLQSRPTNTGDLIENITGLNINDYLLDTYIVNIEQRYGGWSFLRDKRSRDVVKIWYDNTGFHATGAYLNSLSNWALRANMRVLGHDPTEYGITVYNHPLQVTSEQLGRGTLLNRASELGIALVIFMGFAFIPSSFIVYVVRERTQEEKRLQFVGGVGPLLYWSSAFLWDLILILVAVLISLVIILIFSLPMYVARMNLPGVIVLLILFGFSTTPLMYLLEKLFVEASIAFMVLYCINIFIGVSIMVGLLILGMFSFDSGTRYWLDLVQYLSLVFPQYCLIGGLVEMAKNQIQSDVFAIFGQDTYESPFSFGVVLPHMLAMASEGVLFFLINLLLEVRWNAILPSCRRKTAEVMTGAEDGDVSEERRRVQSGEGSADVLQVANMRKVFHGMAGRNVAVDNVSFGIPKAECFGLLGVNGAGKTTLFRILTGHIQPSGGNAFVAGQKVSDILSKNNEVLGYCPQADALDDLLTPEQHLKIYGKLRGIPKKELKEIIERAMARFELKLYTNRKVGTLSRGTKRKVCTAVSMMGNPQIILLDEPTTGMDPITRRLVWNNVLQTIKDQRSVLLTSHSMEECDVLCSRLAIMVNGKIKCLGSPQYLKYKFGVGYTITLRLDDAQELDQLMDFMAKFFTTAILRAHHYNMIEFSLPEKNISLSDIFKHLEQNREKLGIKDFSISQTTLDQVFVSFARQQGDGIAATFNSKKALYSGGSGGRTQKHSSAVPNGSSSSPPDSCTIKLDNFANASLEREGGPTAPEVTLSLQPEEDCQATKF